MVGLTLLSLIAITTGVFLCVGGPKSHHHRVGMFKFHHRRHHKHFHELEEMFKGYKAEEFVRKMDNNLQEYESSAVGYNRSCDIYVETNTGLYEKKDNRFEYLASKVDFDLNRYKDKVGIDVPQLWKYFTKYLELANIKLKLDPVKYGSGNVSPSEVYGYYKNFYPFKGVLWTAYVKPEGTHDKVTAAIKYDKDFYEKAKFENTATINLLVKVPFQRKVILLSQRVTDVVGLDKDGKVLKTDEAAKVKESIFAKGVLISHNHRDLSADPFFIPSDSQIKKLPPCSRKAKAGKKDHAADLTKVQLEKIPARLTKGHDEGKNKVQNKQNSTTYEKNLEDLHHKLESMAKNNKQNESKLQFLDSVINYIDAQIKKVTSYSNSKQQDAYTIITKTTGEHSTESPRFRFKPILFDDKKDGKYYYRDNGNHNHVDGQFGHGHPEILALSEYKGFVYAKEAGFGFTAGGGALVETPNHGYVKEEYGTIKFGICYDP